MNRDESENSYDRTKDLKQFDDSKAGVKSLVDSGITAIPRIFVHPPETLAGLKPVPGTQNAAVPIIDLSAGHATAVEQVSRAAREHGFFQVINHGILVSTLTATIAAVKAFHEQPAEERARLYTREAFRSSRFSYMSNVDLYQSKAASWRDTLTVKLGSDPQSWEDMPQVVIYESRSSVAFICPLNKIFTTKQKYFNFIHAICPNTAGR